MNTSVVKYDYMGYRLSDLALVVVDYVVENDRLKETAHLRRRPASIEGRFDPRYDVSSSDHHVIHIQQHHLHSDFKTGSNWSVILIF